MRSSRRKKQARARIDGRHAQEARRRDEAEADELFARASDAALEPASLAVLIMGGLADSTATGLIAHMRQQEGTEPDALAETARLLIAAGADAGSADSLPPGVLAFAVVAAHVNGDEEEESRHMAALTGLARNADEWLLKLAQDVVIWTHPDVAAEMAARYLLAYPRDQEAHFFLWKATGSAEELALRETFGPRGPAGLVDPGDKSDPQYADRLLGNMRRVWDADPQAKARFQNRNELETEIMRRRMMPPLQVKRLRLTEPAETDT